MHGKLNKCDGHQLDEQMSWWEVWARDEVYLSNTGKVWVGLNILAWAQYKGTTKRENHHEDERGQLLFVLLNTR